MRDSLLDAQAILDVDLNGVKLIEASAGTGKTYTIANLYLRHILDGRKPSEILVVTFTNAATDELRGRIHARLQQTLQLLRSPGSVDDEFLSKLLSRWQNLDTDSQDQQSRRLQLALRCMDEAAIFTIHGFCQRTLNDHALFSGQAFDVSLIEDDKALWDESLKDWWRQQSYGLDRIDWTLFKASLESLTNVIARQGQMRAIQSPLIQPEINDELVTLFTEWRKMGPDLEQINRQWQQQKTTLINILFDSKALSRAVKSPYNRDHLATAIAAWEIYFNSEQPLNLPESLGLLSTQMLLEHSTPAKRGSDPELETGFFLLVQNTLERIETFRRRFQVRALIEASLFATQRVKTFKQQNRCLAYQDQLSSLYEALNGPTSDLLATKLRLSYPVAMIDEFQDTDAIQYGIFEKLYFNRIDVSLTMIGDPKQAIYSFRGGDIFTYMKAKNAPGVERYSLITNWRSQASLVNAINSLFGFRSDAFIYHRDIDYKPVLPALCDGSAELLIDGKPVTPLTIWRIPQSEQNKSLSKARAYEMLHEATATEIAELIQGGKDKRVRCDDQPLRSGDIAVLVRTSYEGNALRQVLSKKGVKAVTIGRDKVFDSEEARGLFDLLQAINQFSDRRVLRNALSSCLLDLDYSGIAAICEDPANWQSWIEKIRHLYSLWLHKGFIVMFQHLLQELNVGEMLAASDQAERRLTNLLHLAELLQQQSRVSAGFDTLLAWYQNQIDSSSTDATELRLESDEELVKIVTIHRSKGLEYPVVFVPYLWECKPRDTSDNAMLLFHDDNHQPVLDMGSSNYDQHRYLVEKERLAEDIRLAYVALTRARSKVYLCWGDVGNGRLNGPPAKTALGYLLNHRQAPQDLNSHFPLAFTSADDIDSGLESLCTSAGTSIECVNLPVVSENANPVAEPEVLTRLEATAFKAIVHSNWRISSFSGLTRDIHQVAHGGTKAISGDAILDFPAGSHVGLLLHSLLEHLDFQQDIESQCQRLLPQFAPRYGLDSSDYQRILSNWMHILVHCPLDNFRLSLAALSPQQRLNELVFDFALDKLDIGQLNVLFNKISGPQIESITAADFRGLITGVIDLVFEYQGKFYLADYKSNFLGAKIEDYAPDKLRQVICDRRYDLQYLLYSIALHRYLKQRLPDYQYKQHFGGVYYLFIRAMRPQNGSNYGVYFDKPAIENITALDEMLASTVEVGCAT